MPRATSPIATPSSSTCPSMPKMSPTLPLPAAPKIEYETFNVLKTKGYNLEHNFGHGKENLAAILATFNLLAFTFHTVAELKPRSCVTRRWKQPARGLASS